MIDRIGGAVFRAVLRLLPRAARLEYLEEILHTNRSVRAQIPDAALPTVHFWVSENVGAAVSVASAWRDVLTAKPSSGIAISRFPLDLVWAWRALRRRPAFSFLAVTTLAVGIGGTVAVFSIASATLLTPLPFPHADELVRPYHHLVGDDRFGFSINELAFYGSNSQTFAGIAGFTTRGANVPGVDAAARARTVRVTPNFFGLLGSRAGEGRTFTLEDVGFNRAVLSHAFKRRVLGEAPAVGQTLALNDVPYQVIGVMPPGFVFPDREADLWTPIDPNPQGTGRGNVGLQAVARLAPNATIGTASSDLDRWAKHLATTYPEDYRGEPGWGAHVEDFREAATGDRRLQIVALLTAAIGVLVATCLNVATLLSIRMEEARSELAVRRALGGTSGDLLRLRCVETCLLAGTAAVTGTLLGQWMSGAMSFLVPAGLAVTGAALDWQVLAFALGVTGATVATLVLISHARTLDISPANALRAGGGSAPGVPTLLRGLCVAQIAVAVVLTASSGLLAKTVRNLQQVDLGYSTEQTLTARVTLPRARYPGATDHLQFFREVAATIATVPGVEAVGVTSALPLSGFGGGGDTYAEGVGGDTIPFGASQRPVTAHYFSAMEISLLAGRTFIDTDRAEAPRVAIVDRTLAERAWGSVDAAIGKRAKFFFGGDDWNEVVGVVAHVHNTNPAETNHPQIYVPFQQRPTSSGHLVVRAAGDPKRLIGAVRSKLSAVDATIPLYDIATLRDRLGTVLETERTTLTLFATFAALTLALSLLGVYATISLMTARRTREFGVRRAVGAGSIAIVKTVLSSALGMVGIGLSVGLVSYAVLQRWIQALLFQVRPSDASVLLGTLTALFLTGVLACLIPAVRALRVDPSAVMRAD